jgi:hypothetical protein
MRAASAAAFPPALVTATPRRCSHRQPRARAGSPPGLTLLCMAVPGLRAAQDQRSFCVRPTHVSERPQDRHSPPARTAPAVQIPVPGRDHQARDGDPLAFVIAIRRLSDLALARDAGLRDPLSQVAARRQGIGGVFPEHARLRARAMAADRSHVRTCGPERSLSHAGAGRLNRPSRHHYARARCIAPRRPVWPSRGRCQPLSATGCAHVT